MKTTIQLKRGTNANIAALSLAEGEPAFTTDTGNFYIGDGTNKVLINPLQKPPLLNTTNYYTKNQVNEYGQVIHQSSLVAEDIPNISSAQVTGLGTACTVNIGTGAANVPLLDESGKFPISSIPFNNNSIYAYIEDGITDVAPTQAVPFANKDSQGAMLVLDSDGFININGAGTYLIYYHVSSNTAQTSVALSGEVGAAIWSGSAAVSNSGAALPITSVSTMVIKYVTTYEKVGVINVGSTNLSITTGGACLTVVKIA